MCGLEWQNKKKNWPYFFARNDGHRNYLPCMLQQFPEPKLFQNDVLTLWFFGKIGHYAVIPTFSRNTWVASAAYSTELNFFA
jgi:hypothetical protein